MPGYMGRLSDDAVTIAQVLQLSGYRTFMSGKWHLGTPDPTKHGFEEDYGTLVSAQSYWKQGQYIRKPDGHPKRTYADGEFYGTNVLTDYALDFSRKHGKRRTSPGSCTLPTIPTLPVAGAQN